MNNFPDNDSSNFDKLATSLKKQPSNPNLRNPLSTNLSSKQNSVLSLQERIRVIERPHRRLREFIIEGLFQVREELLPLLYYSYLRMYMKFMLEKLPREAIRKWRNDFINIESYMKELAYLDTIPQAPTEEKIREEPMLQQIFAASRTIILNQFTFESLFLYIQKNNLQEVDFDVIQDMRINLRITGDTSIDPNKKTTKSSTLLVTSKDVLKLIETEAKPGLRKDEAIFMHLLQNLQEVKRREKNGLPQERLANYLSPFSMKVQDEQTLPLPDQKLKYQIDFAKSFLDRPLLEKDAEPNILHISVKDPEETLTCMEIEGLGNILLLGYSNARIVMVVLNSKFRETTDALEGHNKEFAETLFQEMNVGSISFEEEDENIEEEGIMIAEDKEVEEQNGIGEANANKRNQKQDKYEIVEFIGHEEAITSLNLHYDEEYFLSSSVDSTVRLWCIRRRTCLGIYKGHVNTVWKAKFAERGFLFISGSSDSTARLWTTTNIFPIRAFLGHTADIHLVDFTKDCNHVITGSYDRSLRLWDVTSARCLKVLYPNTEVISSMSLNFYSNLLVTGLDDGTIILWDFIEDRKICSFNLGSEKERVNSVGFSIDERFLVAASRKRISYYEVDRLKDYKKNQEKDGEAEKMKNGVSENQMVDGNHGNDNIAINSVSCEEGSMAYSFLLTRFSSGNFIYTLSRCAE